MLGAIIGDIAGSYYEVLEVKAIKQSCDKKRKYEERIKIMDRNIPLFTSNSSYTDDTVLTISIMDALMHDKDYEKYLRRYGTNEINMGLDKYGRSRFGSGFISWLKGESEGKSIGNGASMRVSPIGYYFNSLDSVILESTNSSIPSHNTEEAIKGANAVSTCIFLARQKKSKEEIKNIIEKVFKYNLDFDLEDLRHNYRFKANSSNSIPQAIYVFLESNSFEDAIRKAISIGGDTDTIAAICGSISEAYYGIDNDLINKALEYLSDDYKKIINEFYKELYFKESLIKLNIYDEDLYEFLRGKVRRYEIDNFPWACFPVLKKDEIDAYDVLRDIKILVPYIHDEKTFLINIHEYAHAFELYSMLNKRYNENIKASEDFARSCENKILTLGGYKYGTNGTNC